MVDRSIVARIAGIRRREVASATLVLTAAAVVGKPITFARDVAVAREFGPTALVDFVLLAQLLPAFLIGVVANGVLLSLPSIYQRGLAAAGEEDGGSAHTIAFVRRVLVVVGGLLLGGGLLTAGMLQWLRPSGFAFAPALVLLLCVQAFLDSAIALYAQTLQLTGRFGRPAIQYAANGLVTILTILLLSPVLGIWAWPIGLVLDSAWQAGFICGALRARRAGHVAKAPGYRGALTTTAPAVALFALTLIYAVSDRAVGVLAGVGTLALWTWALRMGTALTGLTSLPLATAMFSRGHAAGDREPQLQGTAWAFTVGLSTVAALLFAVVGPSLVELAFGSSNMPAREVDRLVALGTLAVVAAVPIAMFNVASRALMARGRFREPLIAFAIGALAYPILIAATFPWFGYLALGSSYVVASLLSGALVTRGALHRGVLRFDLSSPAVALR